MQRVTDSCFRSRDSGLFLLSDGPLLRSPPKFTQKRGLCTCSGVYVALCGEHTDMKHRKPTSLAHRDWLPLNSAPRDPAFKGTKPNFQICMTILGALMLTFIFPNETKFKNKIKTKSCWCYYLRKLEQSFGHTPWWTKVSYKLMQKKRKEMKPQSLK